jgi:transcriptional regulator with XRE-family HTH domain
MTGRQLHQGRQKKRWTQQQAAAKLGVSQPYVALMESGSRRVPERLARKAARLYELSPAVLPLQTGWGETSRCEAQALAAHLASLGYPGFAYFRPPNKRRNPAEVLFAALRCDNLESRLTEALPWIVLHYPDLDWKWLVTAAKTKDLQNRLGFVIALARQSADEAGNGTIGALLRQQEATLDRARLVREDTLCRESLSDAERRWVRANRPAEARHWNLLTDLSLEHLSYAASADSGAMEIVPLRH